MNIEISRELEADVQAKAHAEGVSVNAYVERLIREDQDWGEHLEPQLDEADPEYADIRVSVMEGLDQAERGEARPAEVVFAELRAKHGIPH